SKDSSIINPVPKGNSASIINFNQIPETYKVKKGDTLSSIAKEFLGKENAYMEIFQLNKSKSFSHPNSVLKVGMTLKMPVQEQSADPTSVPNKKNNSLSEYQKEHPLSYITLGQKGKEEVEVPEEVLNPEDQQSNESFYSQFSQRRETVNIPGSASIVSNDAVKVNRTFNLQTTFNPKTMKDADKWLAKAAETLKENNASIDIGVNGNCLTIDSTMLKGISDKITENKTEGTKLLKEMFEKSGTAFNNGLYAIDDVVSNLKNSPYYDEIKTQPKTFDLSQVAKEFSLDNDKKSYMSGVSSHSHRQVPLIIQAGQTSESQAYSGKTSSELIKDLSKFFDARGNMKSPEAFEDAVYGMLDDQHSRRVLIEHFDLDSKENIDALIPAITSESGASSSQRDYDSYFAVGSVMINRTLGKNLKNAAVATAKGVAEDKIKPVTVKSIIFEPGQFEIAWRKQNGATIYDNHKSLNNMFKKGSLQEGNSKGSFELAYEVTNDLFAGMNKISAKVDGQTVKNSGRSTSDLFYFNQSRSKDYSQEANSESAVALIDKNNTHVFFKAWDEIAYFR
ncbi:LysM peptidoglycan-binding domain-containing protein, partial [bacterium]